MPQSELAPELLQLIGTVSLPVVVTDREGRSTVWNDAARRAFGWTADEVLGRANPALPEAQMRRFAEARQRAVNGTAQLFAGVFQPRDGPSYAAIVAMLGLDSEEVATICLQDLDVHRARERHEAIALRERTFALMLEQLPGLVWSVDCDLIITSMAGSSLDSVGIDPQDAVGRRITDFLSLSDDAAGRAVTAAVHGHSVRFDCDFGGRLFDARSEPLRRDREIIGAVTIGVDVTDIRHASQELEVSRETLRRLASGINRVQENERRRIAREIHDELGQRLTGLRLETSLLRSDLPRELGPAADERLAGFAAQIDDILAAVRRIATELRPPLLDEFGFRAAIEGEISMFQRRTGIDAELFYDLEERQLGPETALALYRIMQESLTNAARHSGASHAGVRIQNAGDRVELEIVDDGRGILPAEAESGLGLAGVRERAYALRGEVVIENASGGGTRIFVSVPLDDLPFE